MKNNVAIILIWGIISFGFICGFSSCGSGAPALSHLSKVEEYYSIDDLIKDSPIIVFGTVAGNNNEFMYNEASFAITQFQIDVSVRGEITGIINILQTKSYEDPFLIKGDRMILFLKPYTGPITQNAYRLMGMGSFCQ